MRDVLARQQARLQLLPLVRHVRSSARRCWRRWTSATSCPGRPGSRRDHPEVGAVERDRFRVVLLDEYQDTSHAQVVLLRSLFGGGHPVTAVGDPCQSIYGWRGACAGTLDRFPTEFPAATGGAGGRR